MFLQWAGHWNLVLSPRCAVRLILLPQTKPVLLEKSPRHLVMTRFLQEMMGPHRTAFVVTIRHPLASLIRRTVRVHNFTRCDQLGPSIENWVAGYRQLLQDLPHLNNKILIRFEDFIGLGSAQEYMHALQDMLGITRDVSLGYGGTRRRLLGFHGNRHHAVLDPLAATSWIKSFVAIFDLQSPACTALIDTYERPLRQFGYSLRNLSAVLPSPLLDPYLLRL